MSAAVSLKENKQTHALMHKFLTINIETKFVQMTSFMLTLVNISWIIKLKNENNRDFIFIDVILLKLIRINIFNLKKKNYVKSLL